MNHGKIIDIKYEFKLSKTNKIFTLYFRDSLLLLPASLDSLTKNFKVENKGNHVSTLIFLPLTII
jgi:hypothetical protein